MEGVATRRSPLAVRAERVGALEAHVFRARNVFGRLMARAVRAVAEEIAARRAMRELESLGERELRDIGLTRADIGHPARDVSLARFRIDTMWV